MIRIPKWDVFFFYGLANPPYDPYQLARAGGFSQPKYWDEEEQGADYSVLLDRHWELFYCNDEEFLNFFAELDQRWHAARDPVCVGLYVNDDEPWKPYLAIRATRCETKTDDTYAGFTLPDPINRVAWDRLLWAKCEALRLQWTQPTFHLLRIRIIHPNFEGSPGVIYG